MTTSDTLEAHAPGSITTFRRSDTETDTQAHGCVGMTAHHRPPKQYSTTLQDSDSRQSPARESHTLYTRRVISILSNTYNSSPLHPRISGDMPKDSESRLAFLRTCHFECCYSPVTAFNGQVLLQFAAGYQGWLPEFPPRHLCLPRH
jgi:hypothetical protein